MTDPDSKSQVPVPFEDALEELEKLVAELEGGGQSLEQSLASFERGVGLVRLCAERLQAAELRLKELEPGDGAPRERALVLEEDT